MDNFSQDLNSKHLDPVEVFRGIPYAAPPIGDLRFRPPISPIPWDGIKLADSFGAVCPQHFPDISNDTAALLQMPLGRYQQLKRLYMFLTNQSEDCLFLNLYIPGSGKHRYELCIFPSFFSFFLLFSSFLPIFFMYLKVHNWGK